MWRRVAVSAAHYSPSCDLHGSTPLRPTRAGRRALLKLQAFFLPPPRGVERERRAAVQPPILVAYSPASRAHSCVPMCAHQVPVCRAHAHSTPARSCPRCILGPARCAWLNCHPASRAWPLMRPEQMCQCVHTQAVQHIGTWCAGVQVRVLRRTMLRIRTAARVLALSSPIRPCVPRNPALFSEHAAHLDTAAHACFTCSWARSSLPSNRGRIR